MSVVQSSRRKLDRALRDPRNVVLLLFGERDSIAEEVHDVAEAKIDDPTRHTFFIAKPSVLTPEERAAWDEVEQPEVEEDELEPGSYAIVTADDGAVVLKDVVTDLQRADGKPSIMAIRYAFAEGDIA